MKSLPWILSGLVVVLGGGAGIYYVATTKNRQPAPGGVKVSGNPAASRPGASPPAPAATGGGTDWGKVVQGAGSIVNGLASIYSTYSSGDGGSADTLYGE